MGRARDVIKPNPANCHLAGRMPHVKIWECLFMPNFDPQAHAKTGDYIAETIERVLCEFAATLPSQKIPGAKTKNGHGPLLVPAKEDALLGPFYARFHGDGETALVEPLYEKLNSAERQAVNLRGWPEVLLSNPGRDAAAELCEVLKIFLVHGRRRELELLLDAGLDLDIHWMNGYGHTFGGGFHHIMGGNLFAYICMNQILLQGWSPALMEKLGSELHPLVIEKLGLVPRPGLMAELAEHPSTVPINKMSSFELARYRIARYFKTCRSTQDYRVNRESDLYAEFNAKISSGAADLNDVHTFCKDALFPPLVLATYIHAYADWRNKLRDSSSDLAFVGKSWQDMRTERWPIKKAVKWILRYDLEVRFDFSQDEMDGGDPN